VAELPSGEYSISLLPFGSSTGRAEIIRQLPLRMELPNPDQMSGGEYDSVHVADGAIAVGTLIWLR
jgi:hypothetical protein